MLNFNSIMIGTTNAKELADFYQKLLEKKPDFTDGGEWNGWDAGAAWIMIGPHSEAAGKSSQPARIMLNLETKDVEKEFDRVKEFAEVIKEPYDPGMGGLIATIADPDGNYIQFMTPMDMSEQPEQKN